LKHKQEANTRLKRQEFRNMQHKAIQFFTTTLCTHDNLIQIIIISILIILIIIITAVLYSIPSSNLLRSAPSPTSVK